jgi:hypothetical protein
MLWIDVTRASSSRCPALVGGFNFQDIKKQQNLGAILFTPR